MKKIIFIILFSLASQIYSQTFGSYGFSDAKSAGLAFTYTSNALGVDALGVNPANLALQDLSKFSLKTIFPLPPISLSLSTPLTIEKYNYFFGGVDDGTGKTVGRYLNQSDKNELNELLGQSDLEFNINMNYLSFAVNVNEKVGSFGFVFADRFGTNMRLSKVFTDLIFSGLYPAKIYSFSDIDIKLSYTREISLNYGRKIIDFEDKFIKSLYGGLAIKFIRGYYYLGTAKNNSYFRLDNDNVIRGKWDYEIYHALSPSFAKNYGKDSLVGVKEFSFFPEPAGTGTGFDIGLNAELSNNMKVALAIVNIGSITWDNNQAIIKGSGNFEFEGYTSKEQIDSLTNKFKKVTSDLKSSFTTSLPTTLRLGVSYQLDEAPFIRRFPGKMLVSFDYNQGFNNEIGNSTKPRFSIGFNWKPGNYIPNIRTGFSLGGKLGFRWGFGIGFLAGPIEMNFATSNFESILSPNTANKLNFYIDSRWRF
ncbi:MAG: DUF5723 family protein [Ignavibacteria bacterium]|nr:DUF5723 family protein [Ignavibacteria bacterium]